MDDFGMLAKDFGFRPQGKSAPMKSGGGDRRGRPASSSSAFAAEENDIFNDVFGGPPKYNNSNSKSTSSMSDFDYDSIFRDPVSAHCNEAKTKPTSSNSPVYDKPLYDDDIFDGLPGIKSKPVSSSASAIHEDNIFASMTTSPPKHSQPSNFDDLLGNLGRTEKAESTSHHSDKSPRGLDDLIPGFGSGGPASSNRWSSKASPKSTGETKEKSNAIDDPFVVLESMSTPITSSQGPFTDPLEEITKNSKSRRTKAGVSSVSQDVFGDIDSLNGFNKSAPASSKETNNRGKGLVPSEEGSSMGSARSSVSREPMEESSFGYSGNQPQKMPFDDLQESHQTVFDMPTASRNSHKSFDQTTSPASYSDTSSQVGTSPKSEEHVQHVDDIWLTVSEIPLFTPVTRAPPPSRPPPAIPRHTSKSERGPFASSARIFVNDFSSSNSANYPQNARFLRPATKSPVSSQLDDLENFAMGRMPNNGDGISDTQSGERDSNSASAAMKEAMDRADAKFKHAKEVKERKHVNVSRSKEPVLEARDEQIMDEETTQERLDCERQEREREEEEREQRRLEKERIRGIEREKARKTVERVTREARERAASEARLKAERAAVQRAQAEARERAAVEARERAERAAAEARERAAAEKVASESKEKEAREKAAVARAAADARRRAERAAVERVTAEARERAAAEARERAAAEARERAAASAAKTNQQKNDDDLESFFNTGPSSVPRSRETSSDSATDPLSQNRRGPEGVHKGSSAGVPTNVRKASSTTNFVDDLSSIFGAAAPAGEFVDVEGETEERRRARLERQQRTQERAAKALAEKNQRDMQSQREQEERQRISATLDIEIKRWSAGKEGNLRAMLSTLQYVLWPECGWQAVSLTDLITGASVKKAYRKATLCIHPDKVQQKGANLQQKYVAEKVFDLLKEAWNKFNSEELF